MSPGLLLEMLDLRSHPSLCLIRCSGDFIAEETESQSVMLKSEKCWSPKAYELGQDILPLDFNLVIYRMKGIHLNGF